MKQRGKFVLKNSDSIPGRSVYLAGYMQLKLFRVKNYQNTNNVST